MPRYYPNIRKELIAKRDELDVIHRAMLEYGDTERKCRKNKDRLGEGKARLKRIEHVQTSDTVMEEILKLEKELLGAWAPETVEVKGTINRE